MTSTGRQHPPDPASAQGASRASTLPPPNIVLILTDDQRWDTLGCVGNPLIHTPHVDRLAASGVVFTNNFVTTSICCASRASVMTGLHQRSHGCVDFKTSLRAEDRPYTYYNLLRQAGYRTGFVGKFGVGVVMPAEDFDYWRGWPGQGRSENERNGQPVHMTQLVTDDSLEFLDGCRADQPFCLSVSPKAPHADDDDPRQYIPEPDLMALYRDIRIPYPPRFGPAAAEGLPDFLRAENTEMVRRFRKRFDTDERFQDMVRNYYRLISGLDRMTGRMVERLRARGLAENTVVIFTSDNGYFLGERGWADKWLMYEPSIRTPLVIHDPRRPGPSRRDELTLNIDLAPTLLDLAGVPIPPQMQGRSMRPLVSGGDGWTRQEFFYEHDYSTNVVIPPSEGVRTRDWKYVRYPQVQPVYEELFHVEVDRVEDHNLLASEPGQAARLRSRWQAWTDALAAWDRSRAWQEPA